MKINIEDLPPTFKIEVTKEQLLSFAEFILSKTGKDWHKKSDNDELMTIQDAADYLKLARQTLYQLTSKNAIPFAKKHKRLYFKKTELNAWLATGKQEVQSDEKEDLIKHIKQNRRKG